MIIVQEEDDDEEEEDTGDFLNVQGEIAEWVARDEVRRFIQRRVRRFLETFSSKQDEYKKDYRDKMDTMVAGRFHQSSM
jgi:hypothetical protein